MNLTYRYCIFLAFLMEAGDIRAQRILNGDFEQTTATTTHYNMSNAEWTSMMKYCHGYGKGVELDIQGKGSEWGKPTSGDWFVSLASPDAGGDGFTMDLSSPLIKGMEYELRWSERASDCCSNGLDPLLIGVSNDSMSFGTQVLMSQPPMQAAYIEVKMKFIAPFSAKYISVQNKGTQRGWNHVDNFRLVDLRTDITIHSSPIGGIIIVSYTSPIDEVIIDSSDGKEHYNWKYISAGSVEIDASAYLERDFIITVRSGNKKSSTVLAVNTE